MAELLKFWNDRKNYYLKIYLTTRSDTAYRYFCEATQKLNKYADLFKVDQTKLPAQLRLL